MVLEMVCRSEKDLGQFTKMGVWSWIVGSGEALYLGDPLEESTRGTRMVVEIVCWSEEALEPSRRWEFTTERLARWTIWCRT